LDNNLAPSVESVNGRNFIGLCLASAYPKMRRLIRNIRLKRVQIRQLLHLVNHCTWIGKVITENCVIWTVV